MAGLTRLDETVGVRFTPFADFIRVNCVATPSGRTAHRRAIRATAGVLPDAEGWEAWLADVRGGGADARLERLGRCTG
jgi:hypothetical protein